jgi:hypothetical protein
MSRSRGRPSKAPRTLDDIAALTTAQIISVAQLLTTQNLAALQAVAKDPDSTVLRVWFAAVAAKAIAKGDVAPLSMLLDRLIGRVAAPAPDEALPSPKEPELSPEACKARIKELTDLQELLGGD